MKDSTQRFSRRSFLADGSLFLCGGGLLAATASATASADDKAAKPRVRFGLVTDMHYADKKPSGSRHYRETLAKLEEAAARFQKDSPQFVVELGDFIDAAESVKVEQQYLKRIQRDFTALPGKKHYVLGNHCVHTLTKEEFLDGVERKRSYYSFDVNGIHFVILDACFRHDGKPYGRKNFEWTDPNIPAKQVEWLKDDLKKTDKPTIVFVHQRLDVSNHYGVKNGAQVRGVLEKSGRVAAVLQGHSHKNEHREINGIHYCVFKAMVEGAGKMNNGYSTVDVHSDGSVRIAGHRQQKNYQWS